MSLLIKALDKAEQGKKAEEQTAQPGGELSLEPLSAEAGSVQTPASGVSDHTTPQTTQQATASTVFSAKQTRATPGSSRNIILIAAVAGLILLYIGFQIYNYIQQLSKPELILPGPVTAAAPAVPPQVASQTPSVETPAVGSQAEVPVAQAAAATTAEPAVPEAQPASPIQQAKANKPEPMVFGEAVEDKNTTLQVTRNNPGPRVNPDLMGAYRAFNAGDDAAAQELYRKVLRTDVRNVDALLGMASIAQRQERNQDAAGWYNKVLEVEPRNSVAQAAMVELAGQADPVSAESRLKNLLAQQPNAAHLHAALGGAYTERGQWPAAQQAYFEAHRLDPTNPEYAFNLAVSLDQLGKPLLALEYYKKTLELMQRTSNTTIDRHQLESRISQLQ